MPKGTVKQFSDALGYGFIKQGDLGEDIFVHHTEIEMEGHRTLVPGQEVEYAITKGKKGLSARGVRVVG